MTSSTTTMMVEPQEAVAPPKGLAKDGGPRAAPATTTTTSCPRCAVQKLPPPQHLLLVKQGKVRLVPEGPPWPKDDETGQPAENLPEAEFTPGSSPQPSRGARAYENVTLVDPGLEAVIVPRDLSSGPFALSGPRQGPKMALPPDQGVRTRTTTERTDTDGEEAPPATPQRWTVLSGGGCDVVVDDHNVRLSELLWKIEEKRKKAAAVDKELDLGQWGDLGRPGGVGSEGPSWPFWSGIGGDAHKSGGDCSQQRTTPPTFGPGAWGPELPGVEDLLLPAGPATTAEANPVGWAPDQMSEGFESWWSEGPEPAARPPLPVRKQGSDRTPDLCLPGKDSSRCACSFLLAVAEQPGSDPAAAALPVPKALQAHHQQQPASGPSPAAVSFNRIQETLSRNKRLLNQCGWYYGKVGWSESADLLKESPVGTFLVRDSADPRFLYTLTVQRGKATPIAASPDGSGSGAGPTSIRIHFSEGRFQLDAVEETRRAMPVFESVVDLVEYYVTFASTNLGRMTVWVDNASGQLCRPICLSRPLYRSSPSSRSHLPELPDHLLNPWSPKTRSPPSLAHFSRLAVHRAISTWTQDDDAAQSKYCRKRQKNLEALEQLELPPRLKSYLLDYPHIV